MVKLPFEMEFVTFLAVPVGDGNRVLGSSVGIRFNWCRFVSDR